MELREYQSYGVEALWSFFRSTQDSDRHPIIKMPTGTGKSLIIAGAIRQAMQWFPSTRCMMLTGSQDLIEQNLEKLLLAWPNAPVGVYSAGLDRRDTTNPIIFAGIASVVGKGKQFGHMDLIFVDECDLVPLDSKSQFRKFMAEMKSINPMVRFIGLTATDWRTGAGRITEAENAVFTDVAVDMCSYEAFNWFVGEGFLSPLTSKPTRVILDTAGVTIQAGDFNKVQLERAVNKRDITEAAIRETREVCGQRRKWLVFASGVNHALDIADILNEFGIEARCVHSKAPKERKPNIDWFREYQGEAPIALVNNDILTTGFDDPTIDLIIILRPTKSSRLWVQILGRGTRPVYAPGFDLSTAEGRLLAILAGPKQDCMVLDYADNINSLGPINDPVVPRKKGKGGPAPAPVKDCPACGERNHASVRVCGQKDPKSGRQLWGCGEEFPENVKINTEATSNNVMKTQEPAIVVVFDVDSVNYSLHVKNGSSPMMKARYYCGVRSFDEYVCIEHPQGSFAHRKAQIWWAKRRLNPSSPIPTDVNMALDWAEQLKVPTQLSVWVNQKYPTITDFCFDGSSFGRNPIDDPHQLIKPDIHVGDDRAHNTTQQPTAALAGDIEDDDIPF